MNQVGSRSKPGPLGQILRQVERWSRSGCFLVFFCNCSVVVFIWSVWFSPQVQKKWKYRPQIEIIYFSIVQNQGPLTNIILYRVLQKTYCFFLTGYFFSSHIINLLWQMNVNFITVIKPFYTNHSHNGMPLFKEIILLQFKPPFQHIIAPRNSTGVPFRIRKY